MDALLFLNGETLSGDLVMDGAGLAIDDGLETAVVISLFTDARALPDDILPDGGADRRGWWGDAVPPTVDGTPAQDDHIGSRLWLLSREKIIPETIKRARTYIQEALQWLIDDGIAARIDITVEAQHQSILAFEIIIHRPDDTDQRFDYLWDAQQGSLV